VNVQLDESKGDRVVVTYHGVAEMIIAFDAQLESYVVLQAGEVAGEWSLHWRGTFDACLKWFAEMVGDLEVEFGEQAAVRIITE